MARRSTRKAAGSDPPQRAESPPAAHPTRRARGVVVVSAVAVLVVGAAAGGLLLASGGTKHVTVSRGTSIDWKTVPHLQTTAPPWSSQSNLLASRLAPAGLNRLTMEGSALHIHAHLDVYVNGRHYPVPALVGIDDQAGFLTELHTHDASGIFHVESPVVKPFTLGQFFCEWGVKLTAKCLGGYHGPVSWWINGVRGHGDPAQITLQPHDEIVVAAGRPPTSIPSSYGFPAGL